MAESEYVEGPRLYKISDSDHGPLVLVTSYITLSLMLLSKAVRIFLKLATTRSWFLEDTTALLAMFFSIFHSVTLDQSYRNGLGRHSTLLNSDTIRKFDYTIYTASLLYISAIVASKISVLIFIHRLTPFRIIRRICRISIVVVCGWWLATFLVTAFACHAPQYWAYSSGKCIDFTAFYRASAVIDILTDVFLIALPAYIFSTIQFKGEGRVAIVAVFAARIVVIIPAILRLNQIRPISFNSGNDLSWTMVPFLTYTSMHMNLSIICSSIPCVRPFLSKLESGFIVATMPKHSQSDPRLFGQPPYLATMNTWAAKILESSKSSYMVTNTNMHDRNSKHMAAAIQIALEPLDEESISSIKDMEVSDIDDVATFAKALRPDFTDYQSTIIGTSHNIEGPDRMKSSASIEEEADFARISNGGRMSIIKTMGYNVKTEDWALI